MVIIPKLDLKNGKVVQAIKFGLNANIDFKILQEDPLQLCKLWRSEDAKTLIINDMGGSGFSENKKAILEIIKNIDIPITISSVSQSIEECEYLLNNGVLRVALCEYPLSHLEETKLLVEKYTPQRIIFYAIVHYDKLKYYGKILDINIFDYIDLIKSIGATRLIYGDNDWIANNKSANFEKIEKILEYSKMRVTLLCGAPNAKALIELSKYEKYGLDSIILSKSLYDNNFPCQEIWRIAETSQ